jgi:hypothetical protein
MCATCVAQGAAYLVPAYAGLRAYAWRRQRATNGPVPEETAVVGAEAPERDARSDG